MFSLLKYLHYPMTIISICFKYILTDQHVISAILWRVSLKRLAPTAKPKLSKDSGD